MAKRWKNGDSEDEKKGFCQIVCRKEENIENCVPKIHL